MNGKNIGSQLYLYSIGIVAEDRKESSTRVKVYPTEFAYGISGDLDADEDIKEQLQNNEGEHQSISFKTQNYIEADWLSWGGNRVTAPDVRKGETVLIWRFGGTDQYYWMPRAYEPDLRTTEKAIYYYSNQKKANGSPKLEDSYNFIVDSINKTVSMHTPTNNGEKVGFDVAFDTENGILTIQDSRENTIILKSQEDTLTITTKKKVIMETEEMEVKSKKLAWESEELTFKADKTTFNTEKVSFKNNMGELIDVLSTLTEKMIQEQHIGNLGAPTPLQPPFIQAYTEANTKIKSFKE